LIQWILFGLFFLLLLIGCPVGFAMGISALSYVVLLERMPIIMIAQRLSQALFSFPLLAVPLFLLSGNLMNEIGVTDRIFSFARKIVGHVPGSLGHVNIVASMIFAGMSGSAIADAGGLGVIEIKAMKEAGYKAGFSAAITAASSTIGPIIPPSIMMVLYGVLAEQSVGKLFMAAFIPGVIMGLSLMVMVYIRAILGIEYCPTDPKASLREVWEEFRVAFFPLMAPVILVGGIVLGIFTPTEAAGVAVAYTLILGLIYRKIRLSSLRRAFISTLNATAATLLIIGAANIFTWVIAIHKIPEIVAGHITSITSSQMVIILLINVLLLLMGMVMSINACLILVLPVLLQIASIANIDPIHLGVFVVLALQIGLITPPVGMCLFIVSEVADISLEELVKASVPYIIPLVVTLFIVSYWPGMVLFLPRLLTGR